MEETITINVASAPMGPYFRGEASLVERQVTLTYDPKHETVEDVMRRASRAVAEGWGG